MSDLIRIVDLEVAAHVGVPEDERRAPQRLLVTLEISLASMQPAARADDLGRTVNHRDVAERVKAFALERPRRLIETIAEELAADVLARFPVRAVSVEIKKFVLAEARYVSVRIERSVVRTD